jgi:hypothetical protein
MSELSEFLCSIKDGTMPEKYKCGDGGYLLAPQIRINKKDTASRLWRFIGKLFHRSDWYEKGQKIYNTLDVLMRKVEIE